MSVTAFPAALVIFVSSPNGFIAGNAALPLGGVRPVIAARVAVASCPINFCPPRSVTPPV